MINIFRDPVIQTASGTSVTFNVNWPYTATAVRTNDSPVSVYTAILASKISSTQVLRSESDVDDVVVMSTGDINCQIGKDTTLWGCQVQETTEHTGKILCLSGPISYSHVNRTPGLMFDSRVLFPWCLDVKRKNVKNNVLIIPSESDTNVINSSSNLLQYGMVVLDPKSSVIEQASAISESNAVITGSISSYIISDSIGVPTYMYYTGSNDNMIFMLEDYYNAFELNRPEILDFSSKIVVSSLPGIPSVSRNLLYDRIGQFLDVSPFDTREETFEKIKGYFDEIS